MRTHFSIKNATLSVINVEDSSRSTRLLAQTTLRTVLGMKTLAQVCKRSERREFRV